MIYYTSLYLIVGLISWAGLENSPENESIPNNKLEATYQLVWSDEFDQEGSPSADNWTYDLGDACDTPAGCGWGNSELQVYTKEAKNICVKDGKLWINALKDEQGQWTSARIKSQGLQHFTYGKIDIKAKLPKGIGTWPALWMLAEDINKDGWPSCGEVDIMEHSGHTPGRVQAALHTLSSYGNTHNKGAINIEEVDSDFHIYSLEWTPEAMHFLVDDKRYYSYSPSNKNEKNWPFHDKFFLIMNIAMGGNLGSDPSLETDGKKNGIDPKLTSASMEIDYVRVYQK